MTNGSSSVARGPDARLMEREQLRARVTNAFGGSLRLVPVVLVLAVLGVVFAILSPFFLTPRNITFLFLQSVPIGLLGLSLIFVLFVAEIDLSLAIVSAVTAAIAVTLLVTLDFPIAVALLAALTAGAGIGAIQAIIILVFGAPSFLVTLGVSFVLAGVLVLILPFQSAQVSILGTPLDGVQSAFLPIWGGWLACAAGIAYMFLLRIVHYRGLVAHGIGRGVLVHVILPIAPISIALVLITWHMSQFRGVPWILFSFLLLLAALSYLISETAFGRHVMAVGGNREAARARGRQGRSHRHNHFCDRWNDCGLRGPRASGQAVERQLLFGRRPSTIERDCWGSYRWSQPLRWERNRMGRLAGTTGGRNHQQWAGPAWRSTLPPDHLCGEHPRLCCHPGRDPGAWTADDTAQAMKWQPKLRWLAECRC